MFARLSPEGDTCSNDVQTSSARAAELQEKGREQRERNCAMGNCFCTILCECADVRFCLPAWRQLSRVLEVWVPP